MQSNQNGKLLSKREYFFKNYTFPTVTLSIILIVAAYSWLLGEVGGAFITIFVLTCLVVMVALGLRSYSRYTEFYNSYTGVPAKRYTTPTGKHFKHYNKNKRYKHYPHNKPKSN
jgi:hypothetical protein